MRLNPAAILGAGGLLLTGALLVAGALLPWAEAPFGVRKTGIEGDGAITLAVGIVIAAFACVYLANGSEVWHWVSLGSAIILSGFVILVSAVDYRDLQRIIADNDVVKAGSGIYLTMIAGAVGVISALIGLFGVVVVETDEDGEATGFDDGTANTVADRLRTLQALHADGLITDAQLAERQREIIEEI